MKFQIGNKTVGGEDDDVLIIAEMSSNHCHDLERAKRLIHAAADAGADAVKAQTFEGDEIAAHSVVIPDHEKHSLPLYFHEIFAKGGLPRAWHRPLKAIAEDLGLSFLSTPFSVDAAKFLVEEIGVPALKIASGDLTFEPLLRYADSTQVPIILSTGGALQNEILLAVATLLIAHYAREELALLHCVSSYPCNPADVNVRAIRTLQAGFPFAPIGFSDHTLSVEVVPALAVAMGARIIEKHLTLDERGTSMDAGHSLTPTQFACMVQAIRAVPSILGDGAKKPQPSELHDRLWARRAETDWFRPTLEAREGRWA